MVKGGAKVPQKDQEMKKMKVGGLIAKDLSYHTKTDSSDFN